MLYLLEAVGQPEGHSLLPQIGELAARDLMSVHGAGRGPEPGLEGRVQRSCRLPVRLEASQSVEREARSPLGVVRRGYYGGQARLARHARERGGRAVYGIDACVHRRQISRQL